MGYVAVISLVVTLVYVCHSQEFEPKTYCTPADDCWPSNDVFDTFKTANPNMEVVLRGMQNLSRCHASL